MFGYCCFFGKHLLWAALLRAHISTHWRIFLWCCVCCIKGFISTVCSLSWKNIENCQNIEEQKVFSKAYFGTNWIINAKRRNQCCKNLSSPFLRPHDWVSVGKFEKCAPAALTMDWKVTILLRIAVHVFIRNWIDLAQRPVYVCSPFSPQSRYIGRTN